jgi:drug/metabolite transporter (DMT)-like permease
MKKYGVHIVAILAMLFWGMSFIWSKIVLETYSPVTTIFFRLIISVLAMFLFVFITKQTEVIKKKDLKILILSSIFNPFLYFIGENFGLQNVSVSLTSVIISTIPVITPFIVIIFYSEKITKLNILGLILSFIGVLIIIFSDSEKLEGNFVGIALLFMAVISAIFYTIFVKKLSNNYKAITIVAWQNLFGIILFLPLFLYFDFNEVIHITPDYKTLFSLAMLGILASSSAFIFYTYAIKLLGIIKTNLYTNLVPVFAFIFSFIILGETVTLLKLSGLIIVLLGVVLSESNR